MSDDLDSDSHRLALVRRYFGLHNQGDYYSVLTLLHEDFVFVPLKRNTWSPPGGHFHGPEGYRSVLDHLNVRERGYGNDMTTIRTVGNHVLATGTVRRQEDAGTWTTKEVAMIFSFSGSLISRIEGFLTEREALASLSQGEQQDCRLTARQREILSLLARGLNGPEIADQLGISPATVRTHVGNAMVTLEVKTRAQAVAEALRLGEISL